MAVLEILQFPHEHLRRKADPVTDFGDDFQKTVDDMLETLANTEHSAALSANQMGLNEHAFVVAPIEDLSAPLCLVNAKITSQSDEETALEGCMSVAGGFIHAPGTRPTHANVTAQDRHGSPIEMEFHGFLAKVMHHELEHLAGILFIDHLGKIKRKMVDQKLAKMRGKKPVQHLPKT